MDIGVILPTGVPDVEGRTVLEWARRADAGPFRTIAAVDRLNYGNLDPMLALAAAAAVTERARLMSYVVIPGLRGAAVFAKQAATLSVLAPGRISLGLGIGARPSDYAVAGVDWSRRGRILDEHLEALMALQDRQDREQGLGPDLGDVEVIIGGASPPALARLVEHGHGYCHGGVMPEIFGYEVAAVHGAWQAAGKSGTPRIVASTWYASSERLRPRAGSWMEAYFVQGAPPEPIRDVVHYGREQVRDTIRTFAAAGADEVVLFPCLSDVSELEWLADVVADLAVPAQPAAV
jgi:alkanesulfonate monooxygenase SsuD/methylene tetrahydromethanopterin reductase-like flavin-dependent oxidoreductase (luciferase family)